MDGGNVLHPTLGAEPIDAVLSGIEGGESIILFGPNGTGKTTTVAGTCVSAVDSGYTPAFVGSTFPSGRIRSIANEHGVDPEIVLSNTLVKETDGWESQRQALVGAEQIVDKIDVLLLDDFTKHYRYIAGTVDDIEKSVQIRQSFHYRVLHTIGLARRYGISVLATSGVSTDPDTGIDMPVARDQVKAYPQKIRLSEHSDGRYRATAPHKDGNGREVAVYNIENRGLVNANTEP